MRRLNASSPAATTTDNAGKTLHGHSGGVWEWTSSEFAGSDGFVPSVIYPGYSADFFDGKHFVVVSHHVYIRIFDADRCSSAGHT
jgi:formylglycine-generating enzyme required for sulfatase activity